MDFPLNVFHLIQRSCLYKKDDRLLGKANARVDWTNPPNPKELLGAEDTKVTDIFQPGVKIWTFFVNFDP